MAKGIGRDLNDIMGGGSRAKMESGRKVWGQPVQKEAKLVGRQQGLPIMAGMSEHTSWGGLRVPHEEAGPRGAPDPPPIDPPLSPLLSPRASSLLPRSWTMRLAMATTL